MARSTYEVRQHAIFAFAVLRIGPRGGTRLINVYTAKHVAEDVAAKLRQWVNSEG